MKKLGNFAFSFNFISHENRVKELNKLKSTKDLQKTDIPINIVKEDVILITCGHALPFQLAWNMQI